MATYQMHMPTDLKAESSLEGAPEIDSLRAQRDALNARLDKGADFLANLAQRAGQDSPEYDRYFAEWGKLNEEYKQIDDLYYQKLEEKIRKAGRTE